MTKKIKTAKSIPMAWAAVAIIAFSVLAWAAVIWLGYLLLTVE